MQCSGRSKADLLVELSFPSEKARESVRLKRSGMCLLEEEQNSVHKSVPEKKEGW